MAKSIRSATEGCAKMYKPEKKTNGVSYTVKLKDNIPKKTTTHEISYPNKLEQTRTPAAGQRHNSTKTAKTELITNMASKNDCIPNK